MLFYQYRKSHVGDITVSHKIVLSPQWGFLHTTKMQLHSSGQLCEVWQTTWFGTSVITGYNFNSMKSRWDSDIWKTKYSVVFHDWNHLSLPVGTIESLIKVMACWQLDDKPSPELILKSMTPYHVNWAQKVETVHRGILQQLTHLYKVS